MRREGFLCFGCRTLQNTRDLLDFDHKKIKMKEIEMRYIYFFEKIKIIFFNITVSDILLCYNTLNKAGGNEYDCK
jgi:hypothetical protein